MARSKEVERECEMEGIPVMEEWRDKEKEGACNANRWLSDA